MNDLGRENEEELVFEILIFYLEQEKQKLHLY